MMIITQIFSKKIIIIIKLKVKCSRYRPGVAQRVGRGIALLFHDRGTRRGWVVSSTPRPHFTPGKEPVSILQEARWAPGPVWTGGKFRPHRDSISDRPARSSVAIPTELPGPHVLFIRVNKHFNTSSAPYMQFPGQITILFPECWNHSILAQSCHCQAAVAKVNLWILFCGVTKN